MGRNRNKKTAIKKPPQVTKIQNLSAQIQELSSSMKMVGGGTATVTYSFTKDGNSRVVFDVNYKSTTETGKSGNANNASSSNNTSGVCSGSADTDGSASDACSMSCGELGVLELEGLVDSQDYEDVDECHCECCGDTRHDYETDTGNDDEEAGSERIKQLLMQNARAKLILQQSKNYNKLLGTQKIVRQQQLRVLQRANTLNGMFVRNMESIMRLGFCPMGLQDQTDDLSQALIEVHRKIHKWDQKLDDLITKSKDKKTMLNSVFQIFGDKFGKEVESLSASDFQDLCDELEDIPSLLNDETSLEELLKEIDILEIEKEWEKFQGAVEYRLLRMEIEFIEICVSYGIRTPLPKVSGYEWAVPMGKRK